MLTPIGSSNTPPKSPPRLPMPTRRHLADTTVPLPSHPMVVRSSSYCYKYSYIILFTLILCCSSLSPSSSDHSSLSNLPSPCGWFLCFVVGCCGCDLFQLFPLNFKWHSLCSNFVWFHLLPSPRPHHRYCIRCHPHLPPPVVDCYVPPFLCFFFLFSLYFKRNRLFQFWAAIPQCRRWRWCR